MNGGPYLPVLVLGGLLLFCLGRPQRDIIAILTTGLALSETAGSSKERATQTTGGVEDGWPPPRGTTIISRRGHLSEP